MRTVMKRHGPSNGGRALARELGIRMLLLEGSRFRPREGDIIINWGSSTEDYTGAAWVNRPSMVARSRCKTDQWRMLAEAGVPTVEWTRDWQTAWEWMRDNDDRILVRTMLRGSQGRGITAYSMNGTDWTDDAHAFDQVGHGEAYVKVFGRNPQRVTEYRIHVVAGEVIDRQQKRRRSNDERGANPYIRSSANGWVFCRDGVERQESLDRAAIEAVEALGLDFGAVDCARSADGEVCVYEVNTAPGLEGSTLGSYARAFQRFVA